MDLSVVFNAFNCISHSIGLKVKKMIATNCSSLPQSMCYENECIDHATAGSFISCSLQYHSSK